MPAKLTDEQRAAILAACREGVHPQVACSAAGLSQSYLRVTRTRARAGDETASALIEAIEQAVAGAEVADVTSTAKGARTEGVGVTCSHCGKEFVAEPDELALLVGHAETAQRVRKMAAEVAMTRLERRHPKRWSQKVIHTVQEEHERLLDVAQRVLDAEVFELLLEEYLAAGESEGEARSGPGGQAPGDVH